MNTNVTIPRGTTNLPAGILGGCELFADNNKKMYAMYNGSAYSFEDLPSAIKRIYSNAFLADNYGKRAMKKMGYITFEAAFKQWLWCKFAPLDADADLNDQGEIAPDDYNRNCSDYNCAFRGKVCNVPMGLKNFEILTLTYVVNGFSDSLIADKLFLSVAAIKSRLEKLKLAFNVPNRAALSAAAAIKFGIITASATH